MSDLFSGTDLFSEFDRLQRQMDSLFGGFPSSIRSGRFGAFPQVNIGTTDDSIEIVAFAPGLKLAELDVSIDKGLLTISGERKPAQTGSDDITRGRHPHLCTGAVQRQFPARDRAAAECGPRQGAGALHQRLPVDQRRQARSVEAASHYRPVTPAIQGASHERQDTGR